MRVFAPARGRSPSCCPGSAGAYRAGFRMTSRNDRKRRERLVALMFVLTVLPLLRAPTARAADESGAPTAADVKAKGQEKQHAKGDALDVEPAQWLRFVDDGKGGGKLQIATGTYKNDAGVTVR